MIQEQKSTGGFGVVLVCLIGLLFGFFVHTNLFLFRSEILTICSTGLLHLKCLVNPTMSPVDIK